MATALSGVTAKLLRARSRIAELEDVLDPIIETAMETIWADANADRTQVTSRVGKLPKVGTEVPTIIGDALFNMRSALDHLAHRLVELDGGTPNRHTQFPIYPTAFTEKGNPRKPPDIEPGIRRSDILRALEAIQPYTGKPVHPCHDDLAAIQHLNNRDKHRLLLTVMQNLDPTSLLWAVPPGIKVIAYEIFHQEPLEDDAAIAKFTFTPAAPADFDPHITLEVFLDETADGAVPGNRLFRHFPVAEMLGFYLDGIVRRIDKHFTPLFGGEQWLAQTIPHGPDSGRHWRRVERKAEDHVEGPGIFIPAGWGSRFRGET